jgi:hypothetical protein
MGDTLFINIRRKKEGKKKKRKTSLPYDHHYDDDHYDSRLHKRKAEWETRYDSTIKRLDKINELDEKETKKGDDAIIYSSIKKSFKKHVYGVVDPELRRKASLESMTKYKANARFAVLCFEKTFEMFEMQMQGVDKMIKAELDRRASDAQLEGDARLAIEIDNISKPPKDRYEYVEDLGYDDCDY